MSLNYKVLSGDNIKVNCDSVLLGRMVRVDGIWGFYVSNEEELTSEHTDGVNIKLDSLNRGES